MMLANADVCWWLLLFVDLGFGIWQGRHTHGAACAVRSDGILCRLLVFDHVQVLQRQAVEAEHPSDGTTLPLHNFRHFLVP